MACDPTTLIQFPYPRNSYNIKVLETPHDITRKKTYVSITRKPSLKQSDKKLSPFKFKANTKQLQQADGEHTWKFIFWTIQKKNTSN